MEVVAEKPSIKTVPEGYQRTEVGVIPEDWEVLQIKEVADVATGSTPSTKDRTNYGNEYLFVSPVDLGDELYISDTEKKLSAKGFNKSRKFPKYSTLFTCIGSTIGKTGLATTELTSNQQINAVFPSDKCNYLYVYYILTFKGSKISKLAGKQAVPIINKSEFQSTKLPFPPTLEEQQAIAESLSDVDALIAELDALIEKKQQVKKGAMQQLLTGKKRLPGFEGEWEEKTFDECFYFLKSGTNSRKDLSENGTVGYIHYGDIHAKWTGTLNCKTDDIPTIHRDKVRHLPALEEGDLILADASEDYEGIGSGIEIKNLNGRKIVAGLHTILLRAKDGCIADGYKAYITSTDKVKKALTEVATGTTVYGISKSKLKQVEILLPPTTKEQKAIAKILSDMDAEIQALQTKRDKYQQIKQGMMQELLTGKTRLVRKKEDQRESKDQKKSSHNWQIDEAVLISVLSDRFGTKEYPIGRFRRTKFSYLVRRFLESKVDQFLKKAAGPYNPSTRYSGPERIALDNNYVQEWENGKYSGFIADNNIAEALEYFEVWHGLDVLSWLDEGFRYKKNEDLELLTTVDKSIVELRGGKKEVTLENVKNVIASHSEWEEKLERDLFSDENIEDAIEESLKLFG